MVYLNNVNCKQDSLRNNSPDFIIMHEIAGFYFSSHAKHSHLAFSQLLHVRIVTHYYDAMYSPSAR